MTPPDAAAAPPSLPPARTPGGYAVGFVCLGNICRSPTADVVFSRAVADAGLDDVVTVTSCGTGDWHVGHPMDRRAAATLAEHGYDPTRHRAQQYDAAWASGLDLVLAMDEQNLDDVGGRAERVRLFGDFDPDEPGGEVPDPYYGGDSGFEEVLRMVERTSAVLVDRVRHLLGR